MGYNLYDYRYNDKPVSACHTWIFKSVWVRTDIHSHGNIDMDNDISDDVENRFQINKKGKGKH